MTLQALYKPLVDKLGYDYSDKDSTDTKQLRTLVVAGAANADEPAYVVLHLIDGDFGTDVSLASES